MKTVQNIIDEIKMRRDVGNVGDDELLEYINDVDAQFMESIFPVFVSANIALSVGQYSYDVSDYTVVDKVDKVYVDGVITPKKRSANDIMDGWHTSGASVVLSDDYIDDGATGMTVVYRRNSIPHTLETAETDTDLAIPEAYHNLYVYYALGQIASKEADPTAYQNHQGDYNSLLAEALAIVTKNQLDPNYKIT